jgi:hypothetical protein
LQDPVKVDVKMKRLIVVSAAAALILAVVPAAAAHDRVPAELNTPGTSQTLVLPEAAANAEVISLGIAVDPASGKLVEGFAILHPRWGYHHRPGHGGGPGGPGGPGGGGSCFSVLSKGANWKTIEPWLVNAANSEGLSQAFVLSNLNTDIAKWETAAGTDILGFGTATSDILIADTAAPDGSNEVYFADVSSSGSIAVTIVWGIFSGPPPGRELVEWDQVFDDVDFDWSSTGEAGKMDFENIATHELGHTVGLGHPDDSCVEETMYRFAGLGETKKRTLEAGDIAGVSGLYS